MKLLSIDCETTLIQEDKDRKCRDSFDVPELVCVQVVGPYNSRVMVWDDPTLLRYLELCCEFEDTIIVGHNIPFDILVLCKQFPSLEPLWRRAINENRVLDTMVLAHLREPCIKLGTKGLVALAKYHLKRELSGKGKTQLSFTREQPLTEEQRRYALDDAKLTLELAEHLRDLPLGSVYRGTKMPRHLMECDEVHELPEGKAGFHALDHVYSSCFINTRCWSEPLGWDLDMDKFNQHRSTGKEQIETHAREMHKHGLIERVRDTKVPATMADYLLPETCHRKWTYHFATGMYRRKFKEEQQQQPARWKINNKALRSALSDAAGELGLQDVPRSEKTNKISTKYDYWALYRSQLSPALQSFLDYSKVQKYESLYFQNWEQSRTGRVYPFFHIPGSETLRHASSRPNLHQLKKLFREIFYKEGHVIVGADFSALECYTLCHTLVCLGMRGPLFDTLNAGGDMHSITAARMLGGKAEIYGKGTAERQAAKALNFGIPGGLGAKKMYSYGRENYGLDWSMSEAEELYNAWLEAYDDVDEYLERFRSLGPWELKPEGMTKRQYWQSLNFEDYPSYWEFLMAHDKGRIYDVELPSGMMVPARMFTQSANISFQHLGAVATSHAINKCFQAGLPVIGAVHDAIYLVAPNEKDWTTAFDRGRELEQIMEQALYETCPLAPRQRVEAEIKETFF